MFSLDEYRVLDRVTKERDLLLITDEICEYIVYDDRKHVCPATIGDLRERTITIMGFSKTFSITGWRLGYAVAPPAMARAMTLVNDLFYVCSSTPLQHGVAAGLKAPPEYFANLARQYQTKRDIVCDALTEAVRERPAVARATGAMARRSRRDNMRFSFRMLDADQERSRARAIRPGPRNVSTRWR